MSTVQSSNEIEQTIDRLSRWEPSGSPVLSVYLDVDQSRAANLKREFAAP